jgi:hypothetical protein
LSRLLQHYRAGADYLLVESQVSNTDCLLPRYLQAQHRFFYGEREQVSMNWTEGFSCRREVAIAVGLMPEGHIVPLVAGEDGWFGERLQAAGYRKVFDRSLLVTHVAPSRLSVFLQERIGRGHGSGQMWVIRTGISRRTLAWRALLYTVIRVIATVIIVPLLWHAWRYARCSPCGLRDFVPFVGVYLLDSWANLLGIWRSYFEFRRAGVTGL